MLIAKPNNSIIATNLLFFTNKIDIHQNIKNIRIGNIEPNIKEKNIIYFLKYFH